MESFFQACGGTGLAILAVEARDGSVIERRAFNQPAILIGRDPGSDLALDHPEVSRRHAYLQMIGGQWFCVDLDSRTGSLTEDGSGPAGWVDPTQAVRVGPYRIRVASNNARVVGAPAPPPGRPRPSSRRYARLHPVPGAFLDDLGGAGDPAARSIRRVLTLVGTSPACKIKVPGPGGSRFSAALVATPKGTWVVDLRSTAGISVNGAKVRHARLFDGDVLRIGHHAVRMRYDAPTGPHDPGAAPAGSDLVVIPGPPARPRVYSAALQGHERQDPPELPLLPLLGQIAQMQQQMSDQFHHVMLMMSRVFETIHRDHAEIVRKELEQIQRLTREMQTLQAASARTPSALSLSPPGSEPPRTAGPHPGPSEMPLGSANPDPMLEPPRIRRDPREVKDLIDDRLAAFERERQGRWKKILRLLTEQPGPA